MEAVIQVIFLGFGVSAGSIRASDDSARDRSCQFEEVAL
jgi:hypothetical protein